jgi:hypothetical protein
MVKSWWGDQTQQGGGRAPTAQGSQSGASGAEEEVREFGEDAKNSIAKANFEALGNDIPRTGQPVLVADTYQVGVSLNASIGPFSFSVSAGICTDTEGGFGVYGSAGGGASVGAKVSGGVSVGTSNGGVIEDLAGPFTNFSSGAGAGVSASGDGFYGPGSKGQLVVGGGATVGGGLGGSVSAGKSVTEIWRWW